VHPLEVLADPVRRRILEILGAGEVTAGGIGELIGTQFGITQPAVSQHLRVLRDSGLTVVLIEGAKRFYRVDQESLAAAAAWFEQFADPFRQPLDALATELARGRRSAGADAPAPPREDRGVG
jgi:DNA-binding transcriptional ArsR family regulator